MQASVLLSPTGVSGDTDLRMVPSPTVLHVQAQPNGLVLLQAANVSTTTPENTEQLTI